MKILDLPTEVLLHIFQYAKQYAIVTNYMSVCKKWTSPAAQVYYEDLTLMGDQVTKIKKLFKKKALDRDEYFKNLK